VRRLTLLAAAGVLSTARRTRPGVMIARRLLVTTTRQPGGQPVIDACSSIVTKTDGTTVVFRGVAITPSPDEYARGLVIAVRSNRATRPPRWPRVLFGPRP
jgi:hypothetical protein